VAGKRALEQGGPKNQFKESKKNTPRLGGRGLHERPEKQTLWAAKHARPSRVDQVGGFPWGHQTSLVGAGVSEQGWKGVLQTRGGQNNVAGVPIFSQKRGRGKGGKRETITEKKREGGRHMIGQDIAERKDVGNARN